MSNLQKTVFWLFRGADDRFLAGVYAEDARGKMCFHWVKAPTQEELLRLTHTLSHRVARFLEKLRAA